jgi:hypothetical protein
VSGAINNRYLQGSTILPFAQVKCYVDSDVFMDLAFVDHTQTPVTPTRISIAVASLSSGTIVGNGPTLLNPAGATSAVDFSYGAFAPTMVLQIAAAFWQLATLLPALWAGSQMCQVVIQFQAIDSVTGLNFTSTAVVAIVELVSIGFPSSTTVLFP